HLIELSDRRTLVAAKVWVSPYPIGELIIHTNNLRVIQHARQFWFGSDFVFTVFLLSVVVACFTP
ncbi:hypothetical protein, partial [Vibrio europaeus]|uniref:hypothetical protein n=1 Tax=Vibrio europaeus TaxID=300876 RepID=UPI00233EE612